VPAGREETPAIDERDFIDYYELLNLPVNATRVQILAALTRTTRHWHPDNWDPAAGEAWPEESLRHATEMMQGVNAAREVLLDPDRRRMYDARRELWLLERSRREEQLRRAAERPPSVRAPHADQPGGQQVRHDPPPHAAPPPVPDSEPIFQPFNRRGGEGDGAMAPLVMLAIHLQLHRILGGFLLYALVAHFVRATMSPPLFAVIATAAAGVLAVAKHRGPGRWIVAAGLTGGALMFVLLFLRGEKRDGPNRLLRFLEPLVARERVAAFGAAAASGVAAGIAASQVPPLETGGSMLGSVAWGSVAVGVAVGCVRTLFDGHLPALHSSLTAVLLFTASVALTAVSAYEYLNPVSFPGVHLAAELLTAGVLAAAGVVVLRGGRPRAAIVRRSA
jgi:hypothetical protein